MARQYINKDIYNKEIKKKARTHRIHKGKRVVFTHTHTNNTLQMN